MIYLRQRQHYDWNDLLMNTIVTIRATSITISNGSQVKDLLIPLFNMLTFEDEYSESVKTLGFLYDSETDTIFLHKGVDVSYIQRLLNNDCEIQYKLYDEFKPMEFEYEEIISPRNDEQVDVINFISGQQDHASNIDASQIFLVKKPGFGKTFCSGVGLCKFGVKTLIIMHRDQLRNQWMHSLYNMSGLSSDYVHEIDSSDELYKIAIGEEIPDYDVYLMTHATFRAGLKKIRSMKLAMNIGRNLGIGMKIIDEAHLEFKDTILLDFIFNAKRNLYLTATDGRSSKEENSIFKHVFGSCVYYKPSAMLTDNRPKKWVNYYGVELNTNVNRNLYKYRVVGSKSMTPASYGMWVIKRDKKKLHMKCCRDIVKIMFKEDQYAKLLIFMPLIDLCEECAYFLTKELQNDPDFPYDVDIRTINSKNSKRDNEYAKRSDIIVTTIGSCGTGTDIPGITGIISCSPFVSKVTCEQVFGRIRYCGKICSYYDIWDSSVPMDKYWYQSRRKTLSHFALNVRELSWQDDIPEEVVGNE